jgi:heme A synthase
MARRFTTYAWGVTALSVAVIAGGAVVRATGSGAGCGAHWPRCNGAIVPEGTTESIIEFSHRLTSGLAFLAVVGLVVAARRLFGPGHRVRRGAMAALVFIVGEVLIGAALVLGEWVGDDASVTRAVVDGIHLVNTLGLVAALGLTAWWAGGGAPLRLSAPSPTAKKLLWGLAAVTVVSAAGALTALGDTLFPEAAISDDFDGSSHFLVRLRVLHPVLAIATAGYLVWVARSIASRTTDTAAALATGMGSLVGLQLFVGVTNLALQAPVGLQVVHLLVADGLWLSLVLLTATQLEREEAPV